MNLKVLVCVATVFILSLCKSYAQDQTLDLTIDCKDQVENETLCIPFKVNAIEELVGLQFTIIYDPTVIQYIDSPFIGPCLTNLTKDNFDASLPGVITFLWTDSKAVTLPPDCTLFELCFKYIGQPGESSVIGISSVATEIEAVSELGKVTLVAPDCITTVLPFGRSIVTKYCNPSSNIASDGTLCFYGIGGTGPYTYTVSNGGVISTGQINDKEEKCLTGLPKGTYTITIVDADNIVFTPKNVAIIDANTNPSFDVEARKPSCFYRNDGTIKLKNINVSTIESKIQWSNGRFNTDTLGELRTGIYTATLIDGNGCKTTKTVDLSIDTLKLKIDVLNPGRCKGSKDAELRVTVTGGTPNPLDNSYDATLSGTFSKLPTNPYVWLNAPSGKLTLQVRDYAKNYLMNLNPCIVEQTINVPYTDTVKFEEVIVEDIKCKGRDIGKVQVKFSGTGTNYSITREAVQGTNKAIKPGGGLLGKNTYINDSLVGGKYYVVAKSEFGCIDTFKWEIKEPPSRMQVVAEVIQPNCSGGLGNIKLNIKDGVPDYDVKWEDGSILLERSNLAPGDYKVTVTDAFKCDSVLSIKLNTAGAPSITANVLKAITCNNLKNGEVIANVNSTSTNITYLWKDANGNQWTTKTVTGLGAGNYFLTVTVDGCVGTSTVTLANPPGMIIEDVEIVRPECPKGGALGSIGLTVEGGFKPYTFEWKKLGVTTVLGTLSVQANLEAGTYVVTISDQNKCTKDTTIVLTPPTSFKIDVTNIIAASCNEIMDGKANAKASLGPVNNGKYTFFWSNGQKSLGLFDMDVNLTLKGGKNWVFVTDTKCVSDTVFFDVGLPPAIVALPTVSGLCSGDCTAQIDVATSGGAADPLVVTWPTLAQTGSTVFNLCIGDYPFIVTDGAGCIYKDTVVISPADTMKITINDAITEPLSCRNAQGQIGVDVSGGKPQYTYQWTGSSSSTNIAKDLPQGTYTVKVTDANGCTSELSYTLSRPNPIEAIIDPPTAPACFGGKTCIKVNSVTGGTGNYTMQINNALRIPIDSCVLLFSGDYLVSIFDGAGCKTDYPVTIPTKAPIEVNLGDDISISLGQTIEKIEGIVTSEFSIVNYNWQSTSELACLDANCQAIGGIPTTDQVVSLVVTDENGCTGVDELSIFVSDERNVFVPNILNLTSSVESNRKFEIVTGFGVEKIESLVVYDRWGAIVHKRENYLPDLTTGWDGNLAGQPALPGVYVFRAKVKFIDGASKVYFGDVTLFK